MARIRTRPRKVPKKAETPRGALFGCVLVILLLIAFVSWALFAVLQQD